MASYRNIKMLWSISIISKNKLSDKERNFVAELIDNESHKAIENHRFILHDILEEDNILEAVVEGTRAAVNNIRKVLIANTDRSRI